MDQISKINKILGTPSDDLLNKFKAHASHIKPDEWKFQKHKGINFSRLLPHAEKQLIELLTRLLAYDPDERIEAEEALSHPYFFDLAETPKIEKLRNTMLSFNASKELKQESSKNQKNQKIDENSSKIELETAINKKEQHKKDR